MSEILIGLILMASTFSLLIENGDNSDCCAGAAGRPRSHNRVVSGTEELSGGGVAGE